MASRHKPATRRYMLVLAIGFTVAFPSISECQESDGADALEAIPGGNSSGKTVELEAFSSDGIPGDVVRKALGTSYSDQVSFTARGRRDSEIYKTASPAVVIVVTKDGFGSGVYIGDNRVLTNWHVVKGFQSVGVVFKPATEGARPNSSSMYTAEVVKLDRTADLALLALSSSPAVRALAMGNESEIQVGADVHAIGHPTGEAWTYTKGLISQYRQAYEWKTASGNHRASVIQTQTPINPGNSGGPLISDEGRLIGINAFKGSGEGMNFAVALSEVQNFLNRPIPNSPRANTTCETKQIYEGRNKTGTGDLIQFDTNCDNKADVSILSLDDKSRPISALIDSNHDGKIDITVQDRNRDGRWDISYHDVDFDGKVDLVGYHPDGKLKASRFENYVAAN